MQLLVEQIKSKTTAPYVLYGKLTLIILLVMFQIFVHVGSAMAQLTCHQCRGINCLRTSFKGTQKCLNDLDICVNVYDGQTLLAQGCWEQLTEELRNKCSGVSNESKECFKCNEHLCNNFSSSSFECIQCDSDNDDNCRTSPLSLAPSRCSISRTANEYCFAKQENKRIIRGCTQSLAEQTSCLKSASCVLCQPSELNSCNNVDMPIDDGENSEGGEPGSESGSTKGRTCHHCNGINCLRTSYKVQQKCLNDLDVCATVYDGQTVLAQGCWELLSEEVRQKCDRENQCLKCNTNLCNDFASASFQCVQCDSDSDDNCRSNALSLPPSRCGISRTPNEYCFVKQEGRHVIRGCLYTLAAQMLCLASNDCMICQPSELNNCNNVEVMIDDSGAGSNGSGNEGSDGALANNGSGSGSDTGNTGNNEGDTGNNGSGSGVSGSQGSCVGTEPNGSVNGTESGGSDGGGSNTGNTENNGTNGIDSGTENGVSNNGGESGSGSTDAGSSDSGDAGSEGQSNGSTTKFINSHIMINIVTIFVLTIKIKSFY